MVDELNDGSGDDPPVPAKHHRTRSHASQDGLSPEDERALQDVLHGFRYTWKVIAWFGKAIAQGVVVAMSGLIAAQILKHFGTR